MSFDSSIISSYFSALNFWNTKLFKFLFICLTFHNCPFFIPLNCFAVPQSSRTFPLNSTNSKMLRYHFIIWAMRWSITTLNCWDIPRANMKLNSSKREPIRSGKIEDLSPWQRVRCLKVKDCRSHGCLGRPVQRINLRVWWRGNFKNTTGWSQSGYMSFFQVDIIYNL